MMTPTPSEGEPTELLCQLCKLEYSVWFAPNELWNNVMRKRGSDKYHFVCLDCFTKQAESMGFKPTAWMLTTATHTKTTRKQVVAEIRGKMPDQQKLSDYTLNMWVKTNPPKDTTRTSLYRMGVNDALDQINKTLDEMEADDGTK